MRFRKIPKEVEAIQYDERWPLEVVQFAKQNGGVASWARGTNIVTLITPDGPVQVQPNEWVLYLPGVGHFTCDPRTFGATYERVLP